MRILVIEDEKKIANSIKKGLEHNAFAADVAYDGLDGYDLALTEPYDVIVLDLMLPNMSGIEICKKLRDDDVNTPILMLTAKGQIDERVEGLSVGADDYMVKPFAFEELVARIKALTRRPQEVLQTELSCDDLLLNTASYEVKRSKVKIDLSKKEFALLEYLMRNKGLVLTKDQIIENVWNFDDDVLPNTVEVYIGYLRSKIDKPFSDKKQLIYTVRGFGYKIEGK